MNDVEKLGVKMQKDRIEQLEEQLKMEQECSDRNACINFDAVAELSAHIELLETAIPDVLEQFEKESHGWVKPNIEWFAKIFNKSPAQSLAENNAEVILKMLKSEKVFIDKYYDTISVSDIKKYANQLKKEDE